MFDLNFGIIFLFSKAKNAGIALVLVSIFNDAERKNKPKLVEDIFVQALNDEKINSRFSNRTWDGSLAKAGIRV